MEETFYEKTGPLISPGDLFDPLPYSRVPKPLKVARKVTRTLPKGFNIQGELRELLELGKHDPTPPFNFGPPGEETLSRSQMARVIFLTWGSEVEADSRDGNLHKKHWLIAPVFPIDELEVQTKDTRTGEIIQVAEAVRAGKSARFFPLPPLPQEESKGSYVDFRKICPLAATYFEGHPRPWRLTPAALNDLYHHLIWFFTRKSIFFGPISCPTCHAPVDLGVVFEGQPITTEEPDASVGGLPQKLLSLLTRGALDDRWRDCLALKEGRTGRRGVNRRLSRDGIFPSGLRTRPVPARIDLLN